MSPIYDFECTRGHRTEARQGYDVSQIPCPLCGADAERLVVHRVHIGGGPTTKFRLTEYQEAAQEADYYHGKMENDRGREIPRIPVATIAAEKARRQGAKVKLPETL